MITRRKFVKDLAFAGCAGALGYGPQLLAAEPPPETIRIRLPQIPSTCQAPLYVCEEFLRAEGFTDVRYVKYPGAENVAPALAAGEIDLMQEFAGKFIVDVDAGHPAVALGGVHPGCFMLFGSGQIRSVRELKGKRVAISGINSGQHMIAAVIMAHVGVDPRRDIEWVVLKGAEMVPQLAAGKVDAAGTAAELCQEFMEKKIGNCLVNTTLDRPWSHYFCCMLAGHRDFVRKHPVATKRAMRAILKGADLCAANPQAVARILVSRGVTSDYERGLRAIQDLPYARWRDLNPEDTLRFYGVRLHEAGYVKSSPAKIIAQGTDWRFLNELKKELKG